MRFLLIIFTIFLFNNLVVGQTKYEKEFRIDGNQIPTAACCFVTNLPFDKKIKWYKEVGLDQTSIEAKTKYRGKRHSVEFDKNGVFEDIEITVKWSSLPADIQQEISTYLKTQFSKYKIEKVQIQYTGDQESIKRLLNEDSPEIIPTVHYELVVNTKKNQVYQKMEFLFSQTGQYLQSAVIISKNTDHLEY